jgi:hypothetical protein
VARRFGAAEERQRLVARDDATWVVADGNGQELVVDSVDGVVFSLDGPDGILPPENSFGCPPDLYLGSLAS